MPTDTQILIVFWSPNPLGALAGLHTRLLEFQVSFGGASFFKIERFMNRNQFTIRKCIFYFRWERMPWNKYMVWYEIHEDPGGSVIQRARTKSCRDQGSPGSWTVEIVGPDGRARTINDIVEPRARQFINETRAKEVLIAAISDKEPPIGTRPANRRSSKKVTKLRA